MRYLTPKKFVSKILMISLLAGSFFVPNSSLAFDKRKVLPSSAEAYVESVGKKLSDYKLVGVHANDKYSRCLDCLIEKLPDNAEVITDYREAGRGGRHEKTCSGTALIPKK